MATPIAGRVHGILRRASTPLPRPSARRLSGPGTHVRQNAADAAGASPPLPSGPAPPPPVDPGFALATAAYAALATGDRRTAAGLFDAALGASADAANAPAWRAARRALAKRWRGEAYALLRDDGLTPAAPTPLLGGAQSGFRLGWTFDPLARRPLALVARGAVAHGDGAVQLAAGVEWRVMPGLAIAAERLAGEREAWTVRVAGGGEALARGFTLAGYAEVGVIGAERRDLYAAGEARALRRRTIGGVQVAAGAGGWGSVQRAEATIGRFDIGPTLVVRAGPVRVAADWRFRVAGDAAPGSGPTVTVSAAF